METVNNNAVTTDTEKGVAKSERSEADFWANELALYHKLVDDKVPMIMVSNMAAPNLVGDNTPCSLSDKVVTKILRQELGYDGLAAFDKNRPDLPREVTEQVELNIKYEGYIAIQLDRVKSMRKLEKKLLPPDTDYSAIRGLRLEAAEKLDKVKPLNVGQASRISGVNPADVSVLLIWLGANGGSDGNGQINNN